jgi:uncharacterized membrane protein
MVPHLSRTVDTEALQVVVGLLLMSFIVLTIVKHLAVTYLRSWSRLGDTGTAGAVLTAVIFALGSYLVVTGVFRGIERAIERGNSGSR